MKPTHTGCDVGALQPASEYVEHLGLKPGEKNVAQSQVTTAHRPLFSVLALNRNSLKLRRNYLAAEESDNHATHQALARRKGAAFNNHLLVDAQSGGGQV